MCHVGKTCSCTDRDTLSVKEVAMSLKDLNCSLWLVTAVNRPTLMMLQNRQGLKYYVFLRDREKLVGWKCSIQQFNRYCYRRHLMY